MESEQNILFNNPEAEKTPREHALDLYSSYEAYIYRPEVIPFEFPTLNVELVDSPDLFTASSIVLKRFDSYKANGTLMLALPPVLADEIASESEKSPILVKKLRYDGTMDHFRVELCEYRNKEYTVEPIRERIKRLRQEKLFGNTRVTDPMELYVLENLGIFSKAVHPRAAEPSWVYSKVETDYDKEGVYFVNSRNETLWCTNFAAEAPGIQFAESSPRDIAKHLNSHRIIPTFVGSSWLLKDGEKIYETNWAKENDVYELFDGFGNLDRLTNFIKGKKP